MPHYVYVKEIENIVHRYQSLARPQSEDILAAEALQ